MCAPSLNDLLNQEKVREEFPLFAGVEMLEVRPPDAYGLIDEKLLSTLPERFRKAAEESMALFRFFENKPAVNYAPVFTALLGVVDEAAKGVIQQKLTPRMPGNMQEQKEWFEPYLGAADSRTIPHYQQLARNLKRMLVYKNGISPLGLLRSCADYSLNDSTKLTGVFEAIKSEFRFSGARELLDRVKAMNDFRNTCVAHQEKPVTDPQEARGALVMWVEGLNLLWETGRSKGALTSTISEHDIVLLAVALPGERLGINARGTVVHIYPAGRAYEVEFISSHGSQVVTVTPDQIRSAKQ